MDRISCIFHRLTTFALAALAQLTLCAIALALAALLAGCAQSGHPTKEAELGRASSGDAMLALVDEPGPIRFEVVHAADWEVPLSGLLNLDHPDAKAAGLHDRAEPIQIYFYVLEHPRFGTFIVDSGLSRELATPDQSDRIGFLVRQFMNTEALKVHVTTGDWLAARPGGLQGVFLTHIHMDHIMGLSDVPAQTPIYTGPGETGLRGFMNVFTRGSIDRLLAESGPLQEWPFTPDPSGRFTAVHDVFGDGSLFAIHAPGHTPGSTAFLVRSETGPKLLVGDVSHTAFGWQHGIEPGSFTADHEANAESLAALRTLASEHPQIEVHLGHQAIEAGAQGLAATLR